MTIVYITHYMVEALAADRVVVMEKGHIRFMGTPREVSAEWMSWRPWDWRLRWQRR